MIFKTIEFVPIDIKSTVNLLQTDVNNREYDDILTTRCF